MGLVSLVRPSVQTLGTSPLPSAGMDKGILAASGSSAASGGFAATNGVRAEFAAAPQTQRAVAPPTGKGRSDAAQQQPVEERSFAVESAKARAMAAQKAYAMASLVAGLNPLSDPVP